MPPEFFQHKDIPFACFHLRLDGVDYDDDLGRSISFQDFYHRLAEGAMPVTSQVNEGQYINLFEPILKQGKDILHICISSGISGAINSARMAQKTLLDRYPQRKILIVDSLGASSGYGLLVDAASGMQAGGASMQDVYAWLEANKLNLHHWFFSTDLQHFKRGGRISGAAALFGSILNICPLMHVNGKGELIPRSKLRGKQQAIRAMVHKMELHARDGAGYSGKCFISHSACPQDARAVAGLVEAAFPNLEGKVLINDIGTAIGSHTGPGTVALFFWGDKRAN